MLESKAYEKFLAKLNRIFAWLLIPVLSINFISGYAILHPRIFDWIITKPSALRLHLNIQPLTIVLVSFHAFYYIRIRILQKGFQKKYVDLFLGICYAILNFGVFYLRLRG